MIDLLLFPFRLVFIIIKLILKRLIRLVIIAIIIIVVTKIFIMNAHPNKVHPTQGIIFLMEHK